MNVGTHGIAGLAVAISTIVVASSPAVAQISFPFNKTIVVEDSGNPVINGTNLLTAVGTPLTPGPTDRWLVIVEPGTYDIGSSTLTLRSFVDVEGSGRNSTTILGRGTTVVNAPSGVNVELRDVTVEADPSPTVGSTVVGVRVSTGELKLTTVNVEVVSPRDGTGILVNANGRPRLSGVFPRVQAPGTAIGLDVLGAEGVIVNEMFVFILSTGRVNIGARFQSNSGEAVFEQASGFIAGATENYGIFVRSAQPRVTNNSWRVDGLSSSSSSFGLLNSGGSIVKDTQFAVGGASRTIAITSVDGSLSLQSVVAETFPASGPIISALPIALEVRSGDVEVNQSVLRSSVAVTTSAGTTLLSGSTQLSGTRSVLGSSRCAQSYTGTYVDIPNGPC